MPRSTFLQRFFLDFWHGPHETSVDQTEKKIFLLIVMGGGGAGGNNKGPLLIKGYAVSYLFLDSQDFVKIKCVDI